MKRYAIYGAGSLGTVLGAYITKNGGKIDLINRNKAHVEALRKNGAIINGTVEMTVPVTALTPAQMTEKYDVVFLMTKQKSNADILQFLTPYLHEESVICTTQNGLPEQSVASVVGENRTYGGVVSINPPNIKII